MKKILGRKVGMAQVFGEDGSQIAVTVIEAGPCPVVRVKTAENDGYDALVLGYGERRKSRTTKPFAGQFPEGVAPTQWLCEARLDGPAEQKPGDTIDVTAFEVGDVVSVSGLSKGLGFQGTVRRHGFAGGPKTHGQSDRLRAPGSIGQSSYPSRVFKGTRMSGRTGNRRQTARSLSVVGTDVERNLMWVSGSVPGKRNTYLEIWTKS